METKLRIGFVDYVLEPDKPGQTGLSDIVWDMSSELINQGHEAHVIASYPTDQYPDPRVIVHNFPVPPIGYRNIIGHFWILKRAASIAKKLDLDIIHAPEYISTAVFASLGIKTPLIFTTPGNIYHRLKFGHGYEWHMVQVLKWAAKVSARKCTKIIALSNEMKKWWEWTGSQPENTIVIPLGVNSRLYRPIPDARCSVNIPENQIALLYMGRFSVEKGLLDLVEAMQMLVLSCPDSRIHIYLIGKGALRVELESRLQKYSLQDYFSLIDWVDKSDTPVWYSAADALILPSYSEAFSRTIPEAMACGLPVIGSKITGTEDYIDPNQNGILFQPGNLLELFNIFYNINSGSISFLTMRQAALDTAKQSFSWPDIIKRIIREIYIPSISGDFYEHG